MNNRKILDIFILFVIVYSVYSINAWFGQKSVQNSDEKEKKIPLPSKTTKNTVKRNTLKLKSKAIPLIVTDSCSVLEVFIEKPVKRKYKKPIKVDDNKLTVIGITVFLIIMLLNAIIDVLKVKEEERAKKKLNSGGERRQSLAEFANKKTLRRESSKFGLQLFQIAESFTSPDEERKNYRQCRPYARGDSINSYLSETHWKPQEGSAPASISDSSAGETKPRLMKRQSAAKLIGARPVPMVRRSSFPVLPLNPDVQALMLGHRQTSVDSDDEDGKGRRVRIIRRF